MIPNKPDYKPSQLMDMIVVTNPYFDTTITTSDILAVMADPNVPTNEKSDRIKSLVNGAHPVSVGAAIDKLKYLVELGEELDGGCDGLDALCYHMSMGSVDDGIAALQKVKARFELWRQQEINRRDDQSVAKLGSGK